MYVSQNRLPLTHLRLFDDLGPLSGLVKSATNAIDNVNSALQREAFKVEAREKMEEFDAKYPVKSETVVKLVAGIITYRLIKSGLDVLLR